MKSKISLILTIGIIGLILSFSVVSVPAEYGVEVGDTFTYTVNEASGDFNYKTNTSTTAKSVTGYQLGDDVIPVGSELLVNITAVSAFSATMNISSGTASVEETASGLFTVFALAALMMLPLLVIGGETNLEVDSGISLGEWLFLMASDTDWTSFTEDWNVSDDDVFNDTSSGEMSLVTGSALENSDRDIRFWITLIGTYVNETEEINLQSNHKVMFAYDTSTGVLLGFRMNTDITGTFEGTTTKFKMDLEIIRDEYTLPSFPGSVAPGFESFLAILSLLVVVPVLRRKKR